MFSETTILEDIDQNIETMSRHARNIIESEKYKRSGEHTVMNGRFGENVSCWIPL